MPYGMLSEKSISVGVWSTGFLLEDCSALFSNGETSVRNPMGFSLQQPGGPTPQGLVCDNLSFLWLAEFAWTVRCFPPQTVRQVVWVLVELLWSSWCHIVGSSDVASSVVSHIIEMLLSSFEPWGVCIGLLPSSACDHNSCNLELVFWFFVEIV